MRLMETESSCATTACTSKDQIGRLTFRTSGRMLGRLADSMATSRSTFVTGVPSSVTRTRASLCWAEV